jgi:hypothetical protein
VRTKKDEIREAAEQSLVSFIKLVAPHRVLGAVHEEVIQWWTRDDAWDHQLLLLPRDHQKSALIAYRVAWEITKDPTTTVLYISATSNLAEKQLYFIKSIFTSKIYNTYWPDMFNPEEGKRERWTATEISVDHPARKAEGVRDPTIFTAGLTTTITGLHFKIAVLDDVVVKENAYTEEGRNKVREQYSLLSSIETTGAREWVVGTRYHPKDLYSDIVEMEYDIYDDGGTVIGTEPVYEVFQREVEDRGDGTGEFLWPRQQRHDGKWFGFDMATLSKKRAKYLDKGQFHAQYYNNPNDPGSAPIPSDRFQYYDKRWLEQQYGDWYYKDNKLNVYAAIDFAFSLRAKADYTAIVVIGIDAGNNIYVLDIDRFRTDRISEYFDHIRQMHTKWSFRKLRAEVTVAQSAIVKELKESYVREHGLLLSIDEHRPSRYMGTKEERINAILQPRYDNGAVWHYKGGNCSILEEELVMGHPPHDDLKDALANAVDIASPPRMRRNRKERDENILYHPRFGGIAV